MRSTRITFCTLCANDDLSAFANGVCRLCGGVQLTTARRIANLESALEATFRVTLRASGMKIGRFDSRLFAQEYTIRTPVAAYRLDFAWVGAKLGLEIQGGTRMRGAHSRPAGQMRDETKRNRLLALGWRVAGATDVMLDDPFAVLEQLHAILEVIP